VTSPRLSSFTTQRFSPTLFSPDHVATQAQVDALLDAARRAPSAGNSQPWAFIVGMRADAVHARLVCHLAPSSARWAPTASLLIANLSQQRVAGSDLEYSEFARYDLGQAVAHFTVQAHLLGLAVHQFRAFDREGLAAEFGVPAHWEVTSLAAIGLPSDGADSGAGTSRDRKSIADVTWARA
jgi:nitroreductase